MVTEKQECLQVTSELVEFQFRPSQSGWKSVPYPRTGGREAPVAKNVTSPDVADFSENHDSPITAVR